MYQRTITKATLAAFHRHLQETERRPATIAKYLREVQDFARHLEPGQPVEKETVLAWKAALARRYAAGTVNGKLAALNTFFAFLGWGECRVKALRRQRELFRDPGRELHKGDYLRLLAAAKGTGNWRLYYLMETLASTGIRVSELKFVTVRPCTRGGPGWKGRGRAGWSSSPPSCAGCWPSTAGSGGLLRGRCSSPGRGGPWTGPTSGRNCTPCARRRGWRPSGSSPTTSGTSSPRLFTLWKRILQSWRTSWATPAWRRRESISWRAAPSTGARWNGWDWWFSVTTEFWFCGTNRLPGGHAPPESSKFSHFQRKKCAKRSWRKLWCFSGVLSCTFPFFLLIPGIGVCYTVCNHRQFFLNFLWTQVGFPACGTTKPKFCGSPGEGPKNEGGEQCEKV